MVDAGDKQDAQGKTEKKVFNKATTNQIGIAICKQVFKSKKWQDAMNSSEMLTDLSNH